MHPTAPSARRKRNLNVVSLDPPGDTRLSIERYRATWRPPHPGAALPKLGLGRFIVVAETDAQALASGAPRLSGRGTKVSLICSVCAASRRIIRGRPISTR